MMTYKLFNVSSIENSLICDFNILQISFVFWKYSLLQPVAKTFYITAFE